MRYGSGKGPGHYNCISCMASHPGVSCEAYQKKVVARQQPEPVIQPKETCVRSGPVSVPPSLQNLAVKVVGDGVWIIFEALDGQRACVNVGNIAHSTMIPGKENLAVLEWMKDRKEWANRGK